MTVERPPRGRDLSLGKRAGLFLGIVLSLSWFTNIEPGRRFIAEPVTQVSVLVSRMAINAFGGAARSQGSLLLGPSGTLDVKDGCNGIMAMILFTAAVAAHAAAPAAKFVALMIGIPAIWAVNLLRIVTLYLVEALSPAHLEFFHVYFWQTLVIIFVAVLWYLWADRISRGEPNGS